MFLTDDANFRNCFDKALLMMIQKGLDVEELVNSNLFYPRLWPTISAYSADQEMRFLPYNGELEELDVEDPNKLFGEAGAEDDKPKDEDEEELYLCKKLACSSILKPSGRFLDLYTQGNSSRFEVIKKEKISITNISTIFKHRNSLDFLKIDVQGYELEVIKGFGKVRPLLIETEFSNVPIYQDSVTFFELGKEIYDLGYIMFHLSYGSAQRPIFSLFTRKHVNQIPIHGDAFFMPDWTRKKGIDIIKGRKAQWEALMLIFGMESIFDYANSEINDP